MILLTDPKQVLDLEDGIIGLNPQKSRYVRTAKDGTAKLAEILLSIPEEKLSDAAEFLIANSDGNPIHVATKADVFVMAIKHGFITGYSGSGKRIAADDLVNYASKSDMAIFKCSFVDSTKAGKAGGLARGRALRLKAQGAEPI